MARRKTTYIAIPDAEAIMRAMTKRAACAGRVDAALETARDLLDGTICECGDLDNDHQLVMTSEQLGACGADDCACQGFLAAQFRVSRAV